MNAVMSLVAGVALAQVQTVSPIRFIVGHREATERVRKLLLVPAGELEAEAAKVSYVVRRQSDSVALYSADAFDIQRVDLALKGQQALAELLRQKRTTFTLGELSGDAKSGMLELLKQGALHVGTAAFNPATKISIGFHYYVTIESNGKSVENVISLEPPSDESGSPPPLDGKPWKDPAPPPDINQLFVAYESKRTPSQRRSKALAELMDYFSSTIEKQNEDIVKVFALLESAGSWEQTIVKGTATKGLDEPLKRTLLSSLTAGMDRYGFKTKGDVERFVDGASVTKLRRAPSLHVTGVVGGQRRSVNFSATINRGG